MTLIKVGNKKRKWVQWKPVESVKKWDSVFAL